MPDVVFVAIVIAFFAAASGFVLLCDRIIGPADEAATIAPVSRRQADAPSAEAA